MQRTHAYLQGGALNADGEGDWEVRRARKVDGRDVENDFIAEGAYEAVHLLWRLRLRVCGLAFGIEGQELRVRKRRTWRERLPLRLALPKPRTKEGWMK